MSGFKQTVRQMPVVSGVLAARRNRAFGGSAAYWESRYAGGGTSGSGSTGRLARFKAGVLNEFVATNSVESVIELGCGDGNQLALAEYPRYLGLDVSRSTLATCKQRFADDPTKSFVFSAPEVFADPAHFLTAELALSLDVVYHLVEDAVFEAHMAALFGAATRFVAVYSSDHDEPAHGHVRHRAFSAWVTANAPDWRPMLTVANPYPFDPSAPEQTSFADFHFFAKQQPNCD